MEKGRKPLLILLVFCLVVSVGLTYYKTVVIKNFIVIEEELESSEPAEGVIFEAEIIEESSGDTLERINDF